MYFCSSSHGPYTPIGIWRETVILVVFGAEHGDAKFRINRLTILIYKKELQHGKYTYFFTSCLQLDDKSNMTCVCFYTFSSTL
jgi:hypothetical protein